MKKLSALILIPILVVALSSRSYSQPQFTIHVTGGYNLPLPDLKGDLLDSADGVNTLVMNQGFNMGADFKYYLGKKRNVGITLSLSYNLFSNSESDTLGERKVKLNAFTPAIGVEYAFLPKGKTNPFLGLEFLGNFYSGNSTFTPTTGTETTADLKSASRFGISIGGGIDFAFSKNVGAVIGIKYHLSNLIGKEEYDSTANTLTEYQLVDKETTIGTSTFPSKNISYIQFYAGVSFFLNHPKKMKK